MQIILNTTKRLLCESMGNSFKHVTFMLSKAFLKGEKSHSEIHRDYRLENVQGTIPDVGICLK